MLHDKIPDPKKREESCENITQGIQSRFFVDAVRRFDRLQADVEACLTEQSWMAGKEFSLADIGYAPYIRRLQDFQLQFLWDKRPHLAAWFGRVAKRSGYQQGFEDWPNEAYASLMKEKGAEAQSRIQHILTLA